jgi:hypothetical protein
MMNINISYLSVSCFIFQNSFICFKVKVEISSYLKVNVLKKNTPNKLKLFNMKTEKITKNLNGKKNLLLPLL